MTRDDIIRLGRESQRECFSDGGHWFSMEVRDLERFAALVAAEEHKALREERRKDMAEIHSLREAEESLREKVERLQIDAERYRLLKSRVENYDGHACFPEIPCSPFDAIDAAVDGFFKQAALRRESP